MREMALSLQRVILTRVLLRTQPTFIAFCDSRQWPTSWYDGTSEWSGSFFLKARADVARETFAGRFHLGITAVVRSRTTGERSCGIEHEGCPVLLDLCDFGEVT